MVIFHDSKCVNHAQTLSWLLLYNSFNGNQIWVVQIHNAILRVLCRPSMNYLRAWTIMRHTQDWYSESVASVCIIINRCMFAHSTVSLWWSAQWRFPWLLQCSDLFDHQRQCMLYNRLTSQSYKEPHHVGKVVTYIASMLWSIRSSETMYAV